MSPNEQAHLTAPETTTRPQIPPKTTWEPPPTLHRTYQLTKEDWLAGFKVLRKHRIRKRTWSERLATSTVLPGMFLGMALIILIELGRAYQPMNMQIDIALAFLAASWLSIFLIDTNLKRINRKAMFTDHGPYLRDHQFEITVMGVKVENTIGAGYVKWDAFTHMEDDSANLYLIVNDDSVLILPKKALGHELISVIKKFTTR